MRQRFFSRLWIIVLSLLVLGPVVFHVHAEESESWIEWLLNENWDQLCPWIEQHPPDPSISPSQMAYARYRCLLRDGQKRNAWTFLNRWLSTRSRVNGQEELWVGYIDTTAEMFRVTGDQRYWKIYQGFLRHNDRFIRYYSAFRLSYWSIEKYRQAAIPVLKEIMTKETDPDLLARSQLAWYRIRPNVPPPISRKRFDRLSAHILVELKEKGGGEAVRLRLPVDWAIWWLRHDDHLPLDEKTRERIIERLNKGMASFNGGEQVILEVREPDLEVIIRYITGRNKNSEGGKR